jgi:peroxiredoxin
MGPAARASALAVLSVAAVGLHWLTPAGAAAASFVVLVLAAFAVASLNVIQARLAYNVAAVGYFATVYLGSDSLALGLSALSTLALVLRFYEAGARVTGDLADYITPLGLLAGLVALAFAWPTGAWGWAVAPGLLGLAVFTLTSVHSIVVNRRDYQRFRERLSEGMVAPDFELPVTAPASGQRETFKLSDCRGGWVLLFFLRATWCPVCQMVARIYQRQHDALRERGVELIVVSPTSGAETEAFAQSLGLTYTIVHDEGTSVGRAYDAMQSFGDSRSNPVLPVAILVDPAGIIRHISKVDDPAIASDPDAVAAILASVARAA